MSKIDIAEIFGSHVFDERAMRQHLPANVHQSMRRIREEGMEWDPGVAEIVANAMKAWAIELGATHYMHWFSPMTGLNAGKKESFVNGVSDGNPILEFSGSMLMKSEPDASSFPSGGLRATFEARGYTVWDPASPAFVMDHTLYIPTAFHAFTGEALDQKTPLLRSIQALNKQALRVLRALGDEETISVQSSVGAEQEYFLLDKAVADERLDLKLCGYTLVGAPPARAQQLEDQYYATTPQRVLDFMYDLNEQLWRLGVPAKTEHHETAPGQYELACVYSQSPITCDHNQLVMDLVGKTATRHGLTCLLHEKPFRGINGSGKHNNWSLVTNGGKNLLSPGKTAQANKRFQLFMAATMSAVDEHAELVRAAAACPGNDFRLGAAEAPPAIISVFLGDKLVRDFDAVANDEPAAASEKNQLLTGVKSLPLLEIDDNDRNRTSPFAFTGNKFEFRMCGSSQPLGMVNTILNAVVADTLRIFADELEAGKTVDEVIKKHYSAHRRIIFNGNNYTQEWVEEAARRGLPNNASTVSALPALASEKSIELFTRTKVLTRDECLARYEHLCHNYTATKTIAATTLLEMVYREILPAGIAYLQAVSAANNQAYDQGARNGAIAAMGKRISECIDGIYTTAVALEQAIADAKAVHGAQEHAQACRDFEVKEMAAVRDAVDALEPLIAKDYWPMPTYSELIYSL